LSGVRYEDQPMTIQKTPVESSQPEPAKPHERDLVLTHHEAEAGGPMDVAACGEEDPGAALESLVTRDEHTDSE
jgi:hypothetical protein